MLLGQAGGGAAGLVTGGAIGAVAGVVPAFVTFGASIPIFTAVGSGCGLVLGSAAGAQAAKHPGLFTKTSAMLWSGSLQHLMM